MTAQTPAAVGRRNFIRTLLGLCAGTLAGSPGGRAAASPGSGALGDWLRERGPGVFPDLAALRRLGALYLAAHPEEHSRAALSHLLLDADPGTIPSRLLRTLERDWSSHQVTVVDGWLLARTEARLCAALHLEAGASA